MTSVSLAVAYVGGVLTLFSPCSALLVPSFFAYAFSSSRTRLAGRTAVFFAGLLAGLLPVGVTLGSLGGVLLGHLRGLTSWGGALIMVFGLWQILALPVPRLSWFRGGSRGEGGRLRSRGEGGVAGRDKTSVPGVLLLGLTYGLATTGCSGPILGAIGAYAVTGASAWSGALIMLCFALGMFTPVAILAFTWNYVPKSWVRPRAVTVLGRPTTWGNVFSGAVMIVLGLIMTLFGGGHLSTSLLSASSQANLETAVARVFSAIPDWTVLLLLVLVVLLVVLYLRQSRRRVPKAELSQTDSCDVAVTREDRS